MGVYIAGVVGGRLAGAIVLVPSSRCACSLILAHLHPSSVTETKHHPVQYHLDKDDVSHIPNSAYPKAVVCILYDDGIRVQSPVDALIVKPRSRSTR